MKRISIKINKLLYNHLKQDIKNGVSDSISALVRYILEKRYKLEPYVRKHPKYIPNIKYYKPPVANIYEIHIFITDDCFNKLNDDWIQSNINCPLSRFIYYLLCRCYQIGIEKIDKPSGRKKRFDRRVNFMIYKDNLKKLNNLVINTKIGLVPVVRQILNKHFNFDSPPEQITSVRPKINFDKNYPTQIDCSRNLTIEIHKMKKDKNKIINQIIKEYLKGE